MVNAAIADLKTASISLDDWAAAPPAGMEWINGNLIEKQGTTLQHSRLQSRISRLWGNYIEASGIGGEVYTEAPCRTLEQGRKPDVAYLSADLLAQCGTQYGKMLSLPQSFPLIAEVVSPTDGASEVFAKAREYLQSGCQEVWLIFSEDLNDQWIVILTPDSRVIYASEEIVTSVVMNGFSMTVNALLG